MANRHLSRSVVLQSLFEWDFRERHDEDIKEIITRIAKEFAPGMGDFSFINELATNILSKRSDLDKIIEKAAPGQSADFWGIDFLTHIFRYFFDGIKISRRGNRKPCFNNIDIEI
jgi:transcription termination factor NusB